VFVAFELKGSVSIELESHEVSTDSEFSLIIYLEMKDGGLDLKVLCPSS